MKIITVHKIIIFIVLAFLIAGCGDNDSKYYSPVFDETSEPVQKDKEKKPKKATVIYENPIPNKENTEEKIKVNKQDDFIISVLKDAKKWLEAKHAIDEAVKVIYANYFQDDGKYGDLKSGINLPTMYEKLGEKHLIPRLKGFDAKDIILSKIIPTDNRLVFNVEARGSGNQPKSGYMHLDISPQRIRFRVPVEIQQIIDLGRTEVNSNFEEYKWIEAENLLLGMQIAFMYFLYEYKDTELEKIRYPLNLSDLAQIIEFDEEIFNKLKFFSKNDFKMQNFNCHSREFLFTATSSGKFPAPKSSMRRCLNRAGWYYFEKEPPVVVKKDENKNNGKPNNNEKKTEEKPNGKTDEKPEVEDVDKPKVKESLRLPSIKGKKVKLDLDCTIDVTRKKNVNYSKFKRKVPKLPHDFDNRLEKILENMGAKVVSSGYDVFIKVKIQIDVDANTWMEEVVSVKTSAKITVSSIFGDEDNSFNGSFNSRDNDMTRCFETLWNEGVDKFSQMVNYSFKSD